MKKIVKSNLVKLLSRIPLSAVALRAKIARAHIRTEKCDCLSLTPNNN